ncbi:HNH endonuclease [Salinisphaera hydrothermalis]|uniref:HNH nuclease domain-containing protein n=1 Tax=Salinisphaera hydrothermalis (strain C41B8) TaxID=1304275 RepID=A0A084INB8_SALHC|nr:HNH endonuclease [Salinisphaera hydrothermalis]KEZ78202.1 hypothetical protein C41B8_06442 [Salinisphaera hydrothermalis C41B8]
MREVSPGDIVFSFVATRMHAIGIAQSFCYECPRPDEFGAIGQQWDEIGWRVDVRFKTERHPMRPKDHMATLAPRLPDRYSPLQQNGNGLQQVYLTELPFELAEELARLMGRPILDLVRGHRVAETLPETGSPNAIAIWEAELTRRIETDPSLDNTVRQTLINARRGQGLFRERVMAREKYCRVTKVDRPTHLRASHCKPWRDCVTNEERLDGENGLFLTPSIDHLFDRGFISFQDDGELVVSPVAHAQSLNKMGVPTDQRLNVGRFTDRQRYFLNFHREHVLLQRS